eukprot:RCo023511
MSSSSKRDSEGRSLNPWGVAASGYSSLDGSSDAPQIVGSSPPPFPSSEGAVLRPPRHSAKLGAGAGAEEDEGVRLLSPLNFGDHFSAHNAGNLLHPAGNGSTAHAVSNASSEAAEGSP